ncbi:hypothetical protein PSTG_16598 [Puccinia striiformis f. sp. tritici PST-78]|uniref:Secreted protein n=1 Tax=Puccinia striiformis f. sp. tritici PST-78 TaxID=1165861 RepID=A0A0L0USC8_9BASI|nr:hypothetical protein PSTG_16598 [Puccinia striiformis f. sp. tritici PST-78]
MGLFKNVSTLSLMVWLFGGLVSANWDPATGHLYNYRPSKSWLSQYQDNARCFNDVQVAECAQNTRLSYPHVQVFATFQVEHSKDKNHGCPYGTCCGYADLPAPSDMEIDSMNYHSFFWHDLAGVPGPGTNPIADPETGAFGYESSDGKFHEGKADESQMQRYHDSHYSGFKLPPRLVQLRISDRAFAIGSA